MSRLQTQILYGLRTDVSGNAFFSTDDEVLYLVGNAVALHNFAQHRQKLIRMPDKHKINMMTIAPNKKYAALCEEGEKPLISIYDLSTLKRKKLLGVPHESAATCFTCISFTSDSKYVAVVTNEKQTMLFYNWEKGKLESSLEVENPQNPLSEVNLISCNPGDTGIMAIAGTYAFKFLTVSETLWRPYGYTKAEILKITALTWLNTDRLFAGTSDGRILFLENGDLKNIFIASEVVTMNLRIREDCVLHSTQPSEFSVDELEILCLITFNRGFAFAMGYGTIVMFEKESQHKYSKRNIFLIPRQVSNQETNRLYRVNTISPNLSSDRLIITTGWSQMFYATLWGTDLNTDPEPQVIGVLGNHLHHGSIGGLSICTWTTQVATFGVEDRSVRIWDYETESLIMMKQYLEDIFCIVLHPTGLFCLIGFSDKLRFMSILIDDFMIIKEFSIRCCKIAAFSFGGHLFAAVNGNIIQVYSTLDFNIRFVLKGHTEKIKGIVWSQNDRKIVSIGSEGAIYEWEMHTGERLIEIVLKGVSLNSIVLSPDGVTAYCISNDGYIHEIKEDLVTRSYTVSDIQPDSIVMGKEVSLMFITYPGGFVASLKYPLKEPIEYLEYHVHCAEITQMSLTYDEQILITSDAGGALCFWKVTYADGVEVSVTRDSLYLNQILISRENLADRVQTTKDLFTRIKELETEHAYKMRQMNVQHNDEMRDIHASYCEAIEELRDKIDKLEEDHTNEINAINVEIMRTKSKHEEDMRQMEINYDAKLIEEYDKYEAFEKQNQVMREDYERQLSELEKKYQDILDENISKYEARLQEKELQLKDAHEEMSNRVRIHEIIKAQIEDDTDCEIVDLRANYEEMLREERQLVLKLKGEAGVLRNKHQMSQKDIEDLKWQVINLQKDFLQLKKRKEDLEKELADLQSELKEREVTIGNKNKRIGELELSNQELDKIRFLLNHRISELQASIDPRDREIEELKIKIADMETELIALNKTNQSYELKLHELQEKYISARKEIKNESSRHRHTQQVMRKIRIDILEAASLIQEPAALKSQVTKMFNAHSNDIKFQRSYKADFDAQCEFMKQRDHLENTIALLKKQLSQCGASSGVQLDRMLEENVELLNELNILREELKSAQRHIGDMESLLGLKGRDTGPLEARAKLAKACHGNEELELNYKKEILECQKIIVILKDDIDRIVNNFPDRNREPILF